MSAVVWCFVGLEEVLVCRARASKFQLVRCFFDVHVLSVSHALVVGVVTPPQAPVWCCLQFPQSCVQFSCVTVAHTLDHLHHHLLMWTRLAWLKSDLERSHVCMAADLLLKKHEILALSCRLSERTMNCRNSCNEYLQVIKLCIKN